MNIAITVTGNRMDSPVSQQFEHCNSLIIINVETMDITVIPNPKASDEIAGDHLAKEVLHYNCEAIITGKIQFTAFELLAGASVTRYLGVGYDASKALELMHTNSLEMIRDVDGGKGCGGAHHH